MCTRATNYTGWSKLVRFRAGYNVISIHWSVDLLHNNTEIGIDTGEDQEIDSPHNRTTHHLYQPSTLEHHCVDNHNQPKIGHTYHSLLHIVNYILKRVQKSALKIILKSHYNNYEDALKILKLDTLDKRREMLCLKFAKNCLKNEKMKKLFPLQTHQHNMKKRSQAMFRVNNSRTSKYRNSAIPYMQRLLNEDFKQSAKILS